jgi:endo-1,4-beta-xylanase
VRIRNALIAGAVGATAVLSSQLPAMAADHTPAPPAQGHGNGTPLRNLGDRVGLKIGTAVIPFDLNTQGYQVITGQQFDLVTPGNEMKWETVEPTQGTYDWSAADRLVQFAQEHGQQVRGHTLLWENQYPTWITQGVNNGTISNDKLRDLLQKHITDEVTHFKGKIWQWDVANEFMANSWDPKPNPDGVKNNFWVQHLGEGIIADAFRWAHEADPNALLFYNDYNITGEDGNNAKFTAAYNFVKSLQAQGVPIAGVGEQAHLDTQNGFNATKFQQDLQAFGDLGLKVAVTEADVRTFVNNGTDQVPTGGDAAVAAQVQDWQGLIDGCLAVKQCISFTAWGFGDIDSWVPYTFPGEGAAGLYDVNLTPKPQYYALQQELANAKPRD